MDIYNVIILFVAFKLLYHYQLICGHSYYVFIYSQIFTHNDFRFVVSSFIYLVFLQGVPPQVGGYQFSLSLDPPPCFLSPKLHPMTNFSFGPHPMTLLFPGFQDIYIEINTVCLLCVHFDNFVINFWTILARNCIFPP